MGIPAQARHGTRIKALTAIDRWVALVAQAIAWLNLAVVLVILMQVLLRYGFHHGLVVLEELMWHLYAVAFLFSISYAMVRDQHIRVDVLHERFSPRTRQLIEIVGIVLLLLPFLVVTIDHSIDWVQTSYQFRESSENPTGLPYRWLIKSMLPLSLGILLIASVSRLLQQVVLLKDGDAGGR